MVQTVTTTEEAVKIYGRGTLVNIQIDDSVPIEAVCRNLRNLLGRDRGLYSHGDVIVDVGQRILSPDSQERIRKVIESESGLSIQQFWCESGVLERERERIDGLIRLNSETSRRFGANGYNDNGRTEPDSGIAVGDTEDAIATGSEEPDSGIAVGDTGDAIATGSEERVASAAPGHRSVPADVIRGTCRAGEILRFPGNVVVVGNVNPGAQIIAQGDILVFGTLRGTAHAGAGGDFTAVILAMSCFSPQLRIADFFTEEDETRGVAGSRRSESDGTPVIARVQNRAVRISPYLKNHSIDHGGNPNER